MLPSAGAIVLKAERDVAADQIVGERPRALVGDDRESAPVITFISSVAK